MARKGSPCPPSGPRYDGSGKGVGHPGGTRRGRGGGRGAGQGKGRGAGRSTGYRLEDKFEENIFDQAEMYTDTRK